MKQIFAGALGDVSPREAGQGDTVTSEAEPGRDSLDGLRRSFARRLCRRLYACGSSDVGRPYCLPVELVTAERFSCGTRARVRTSLRTWRGDRWCLYAGWSLPRPRLQRGLDIRHSQPVEYRRRPTASRRYSCLRLQAESQTSVPETARFRWSWHHGSFRAGTSLQQRSRRARLRISALMPLLRVWRTSQ